MDFTGGVWKIIILIWAVGLTEEFKVEVIFESLLVFYGDRQVYR